MPRVNLLDIHGEPVNVEQGDVQNALNSGYKVPSPDQVVEIQKQQQFGEGFGNELKAFAEGAARTASFGASDYLLPKVPGGPTAEALSERQKRNPISSTAGSVAGIVGSSALLPGGGLVGGASKLATGAGEAAAPIIGNALANRGAAAALSRVGSTAIGSGVLGSLYGAGNVVSEAALGDPDLTAQRAFAQIGMSGLLAGGLGAGLASAKIGFPKAIELAKNASKVAEKAMTQASEIQPDLLESSQFLIHGAEIPPIEPEIPMDSHKSDLVKGLAKYAVKGAKMALPGIAGKAIDVGMDVGTHLLKAETLANLEAMAQKTTQSIVSSANSIFKMSPDLTPLIGATLAKNTNQDYDKAVKQIQEISDPATFMDRLDNATKEIFPHAPQISNHAQMVMASATQFLNSKIPKPAVQAPLSPPFTPSEAQKEEFLHYYNVVNNPLQVMNELKAGNLTKGTVEALSSVHPKLYQEMSQALMGSLMEHKGKDKDLNYQTKAMLSQFLQSPMDESFMPSSIMATQGIFLGPQRAQGGGSDNSRARRSRGGLEHLNVAGRARIGTQKVNLGQKL